MSSRLIVNSIRHTGASTDAISLDSSGNVTCNGTATGFGGGKILQVVQTVKTDTFSSNATSFTDITGMSATITPSSNSNKILVETCLFIASAGSGSTTKINFVRGSTNIGQPTGSSVAHQATFMHFLGAVNMVPFTMNFLDSPATTSATTYKLQIGKDNTATETFVNRYHGADNYHAISTLTLMEVSA